jgi:hypothetical protein
MNAESDGQDIDYIKKWYTIEFDKTQAVSQLGDRDDSARVKKGEEEFQPMYLIKEIPEDPRKLVRSSSLVRIKC